MKKKSHLSLASYLLENSGNEELKNYRKSFLFGSIQPDCIPSFITRRHTIDETFDIFKEELIFMTRDYDWSQGITREFSRHLGVITHYIADYFTYPHNSIYEGTMKEHINYEIELVDYLKSYLNSGDVEETIPDKTYKMNLYSVDSICDFIKDVHAQYIDDLKQIAVDCQYIVAMAANVVWAILRICETNYATSQVNVATM